MADIGLAPIVVEATSAGSTDVSELTTNSLQGTGVFDVLMQASKLHLQEEYDSGKITDKEYSIVYLGLITAVLQQSVSYILNHVSAEKINAEIGLIRQQTVTELTNTSNSIPVGLGFNGSTAVVGTVQKKLNELDQQIALLTNQATTESVVTDLTKQKVVTELAQTSNDLANVSGTYGYNAEVDKLVHGNIGSQVSHVAADTAFTTKRADTEVQNTLLITAQTSKTSKEEALLVQKTTTELAKTTNPTGGVLKSQIDLYVAQKEGFARDAEQKLTKVLLDTWVAQRTTDDQFPVYPSFDATSVNAVVDKAFAGVGISQTS